MSAVALNHDLDSTVLRTAFVLSTGDESAARKSMSRYAHGSTLAN
jgi:hypothetical protein